MNQKQVDTKQALAIFCPCQKKHSHKECPLDTIKVCAMCDKYHSTKCCPSLLGLKVVFKEYEEDVDPVYLMT